MNELTVRPIAASARPRGVAPSAADVERGVNLFILAAATFLRSAAAERDGGRGRPKRSKEKRKSPPRRSPKAQ